MCSTNGCTLAKNTTDGVFDESGRVAALCRDWRSSMAHTHTPMKGQGSHNSRTTHSTPHSHTPPERMIFFFFLKCRCVCDLAHPDLRYDEPDDADADAFYGRRWRADAGAD